MQTKPHHKLTQTLLTGAGLFLLVLAMVLNHYHPRNQGIADITHGSIYKVAFGVLQNPANTNANYTFLKQIGAPAKTPEVHSSSSIAGNVDTQTEPVAPIDTDPSSTCQNDNSGQNNPTEKNNDKTDKSCHPQEVAPVTESN